MEHIPPEDLRSILRECHRISKDRAVLAFAIDYSDHYSHTDRSITPYNFLKFSDPAWSFLNPAIHYQNRLRHSQYCDLLTSCGFHLASMEPHSPKDGVRSVSEINVAEKFRDLTPDDMAIIQCSFVVRKVMSPAAAIVHERTCERPIR